jgi:sucrose phosphorylase
MKTILRRIYDRPTAEAANARLSRVLDAFSRASAAEKIPFSEADTVLVTYGDTLKRGREMPLKTLHRFISQYFKGVFSGIHILPFYPYSSDDGFAVVDFQAVNPDLGNWRDVQAIAQDFKLMVDLVANHISAQSRWFKAYLSNEKGYSDLAVEVDPDADLSRVVRPRAMPLVKPFTKADGRPVTLWTTFSADQIDLNYRSLDVLEKMVRTLLFYVSQGARIVRLDAIAYLWKEIGTPCIHLPQTHDMVRLFRRILDLAAPGVVLITETNVPHEENISYFGNGYDEAQMVYNFTLPPLLLYALATGSAGLFSDWAKTLIAPSEQTSFFNFTASHDGIGVRPLEGIVPAAAIDALADRVRQNGGHVSERQGADGTPAPYELNITYLDALKDPALGDDPLHILRFLASQAVALALPGVPAIYIHSILGTPNWIEGVRKTGRNRTINRAKLGFDAVCEALDQSHSVRARIFYPYLAMIRARTLQPAFHPAAGMEIINLDHRVFAIKRFCARQRLFALTNFSGQSVRFALPVEEGNGPFRDLLSGSVFDPGRMALSAYQTVWLEA